MTGLLGRRLGAFVAFAAVMAALAAVAFFTQRLSLGTRPAAVPFGAPPHPGGVPLLTPAVAVAAMAMVLAALVAGRLLGRRLRHPAPLGARWPLRTRLARAQDRLAPVRVELLLGRDANASPYEVAKLADGLAPVLRPRRRLRLAALLGPGTLLLEQRALPAERAVALRLVAPAYALDSVVARVAATYPGTRMRPVTDEPLLDGIASPVAAVRSRLRREPVARPGVQVVRLTKRRRWIWSLQTTRDYQHSAMASLVHHLHAARAPTLVQLALTPAPGMVERLAARAVRRHERTLRAQTGQLGSDPGIESVTAQKDLQGAVEGIGRSYYRFDWRIITTDSRASDAVIGALAELRQDNELRPRTVRARRRLTVHQALHGLPALWPTWRTGVLSGAEVASCWHLPPIDVKGAGLRRQATRQLPAPAAISRDPGDLLLVDEYGPLGLAPADRAKGLAVLGAAGGGKSSLLLRYITNVAHDPRRALIVVDLKEDLARDALTVIPTDRRVHIIDLHHPQAGLNVLAIDTLAPEVRADILIAAIREIHGDDSVGPRSDSLLRAAITAVCACEHQPTLTHVLRMLDPYDPGYRAWVVREFTFHREVDFLHDFWDREFPALTAANPRFVAEAVAAPRNKLQRFLAVPSLTLATNHPMPIDLFQVIRDRDVLVVNGSKAAVGESNAALFCQLVVLVVQRALHRLQQLDRAQRTPAALVIDEAHNVFTPSFATLLSEGRSAGLEAVAAFQYTGQITDERVRSGVKSLLQNISVTRMREFDDARAYTALAQELYTDSIRVDPAEQRKLAIDPLDIVNAPDHRVLNLWLSGGAPQLAFTADTVPVEPAVTAAGARTAREHHEHEQARRGHHPHDHGQAIRPPLVRHIDTPAIAHGRTVHVDLTSWPRRPDLTGARVILCLTGPGGRRDYLGRPDDPSGRRFHADIPGCADQPGHLPDGTYTITVRAHDAAGTDHTFTPLTRTIVDARKGISRDDPATVELSSDQGPST